MKVNILGISFDQIGLAEAVKKIEEMIKAGGFHQVGTMNPEYVIRAQDDKQLMKAIAKMELIVPDGMGIILAAKVGNLGQLNRIRGGDLVEELAKLCVKKGYKIALVGGEKGIAEKAFLVLQKKFPGLQGFAYSDPVSPLHLRGVNLLLTALSFKGPVWIESLPEQISAKFAPGLVGMEVGGLFNYLAGRSRRPPEIIQKIGLEWLWRLMTEPWRWKRQLSLIRFVWLLLFRLHAEEP